MRVRNTAALLVVSALVVAACSSSGSTAGANSGGAGSTDASGHVSLPQAGGGSCSVNVTGGITASWTSPQTVGSLLVSYWLSAVESALLSLPPDQTYFLMNCQSSSGTLSLTTSNDTLKSQFPEAPGTYVIQSGGILGGVDTGKLGALVTFPGHALWRVTKDGQFVVTDFDARQIKGTFSFEIGEEGSDLSTIITTANLTGTFQFNCISGGCH